MRKTGLKSLMSLLAFKSIFCLGYYHLLKVFLSCWTLISCQLLIASLFIWGHLSASPDVFSFQRLYTIHLYTEIIWIKIFASYKLVYFLVCRCQFYLSNISLKLFIGEKTSWLTRQVLDAPHRLKKPSLLLET